MERRLELLSQGALMIGQLALRMKRDAVNDIAGEDLALQDFIAEDCRETLIHEDDPASCLAYASKVLQVLTKAVNHEYKGIELGLSIEERQMADMLWGFAPHNYTPDIVALAKESVSLINRRMKRLPHHPSKESKRKFIAGILGEINEMAKKYGINYDSTNGFCLELAYVGEWLDGILLTH